MEVWDWPGYISVELCTIALFFSLPSLTTTSSLPVVSKLSDKMADQKIAPVSTPEINFGNEEKINAAQHVEEGYDEMSKDHMNYERVDAEVAKCMYIFSLVMSTVQESSSAEISSKTLGKLTYFACSATQPSSNRYETCADIRGRCKRRCH